MRCIIIFLNYEEQYEFDLNDYLLVYLNYILAGNTPFALEHRIRKPFHVRFPFRSVMHHTNRTKSHVVFPSYFFLCSSNTWVCAIFSHCAARSHRFRIRVQAQNPRTNNCIRCALNAERRIVVSARVRECLARYTFIYAINMQIIINSSTCARAGVPGCLCVCV